MTFHDVSSLQSEQQIIFFNYSLHSALRSIRLSVAWGKGNECNLMSFAYLYVRHLAENYSRRKSMWWFIFIHGDFQRFLNEFIEMFFVIGRCNVLDFDLVEIALRLFWFMCCSRFFSLFSLSSDPKWLHMISKLSRNVFFFPFITQSLMISVWFQASDSIGL